MTEASKSLKHGPVVISQNRPKTIYLALIIAVFVPIFFFVLIYPRPFKKPDFSDLSVSTESYPPEFTYSGLWRGCDVQVLPTEFTDLSSVDILENDIESLFSPWLQSLDGILHQEAYFHTLDFDECFEAINSAYPGADIEQMIFDGAPNTFLRIGGLREYSVPLSHANTILVFAALSGQQKIILLRGGN